MLHPRERANRRSKHQRKSGLETRSIGYGYFIFRPGCAHISSLEDRKPRGTFLRMHNQ